MTRAHVSAVAILAVGLLVFGAPGAFGEQRGGRGGGGSSAPRTEVRSRLEILTDIFTLDKDQKKVVKETLDAAYKEAAPIRAALKKARTDLGAAVLASKPPAEVEAATKAYGAQAAAMAEAEMKAFAQVLTPLKAEQRATGTNPAFNLMRGIFLDDKKWDEIPELKAY